MVLLEANRPLIVDSLQQANRYM